MYHFITVYCFKYNTANGKIKTWLGNIWIFDKKTRAATSLRISRGVDSAGETVLNLFHIRICGQPLSRVAFVFEKRSVSSLTEHVSRTRRS